MPDISIGSLDTTIKRLKKYGCIERLECGPFAKRWRYIAPLPTVGYIEPNTRTTPEQREMIYRICAGKGRKIADIAAETGLSKHVVRTALSSLRMAKRVKCKRPGQIWMQTENFIEHIDRSRVFITESDRQWCRYWHPDNRENRRREQQCC